MKAKHILLQGHNCSKPNCKVQQHCAALVIICNCQSAYTCKCTLCRGSHPYYFISSKILLDFICQKLCKKGCWCFEDRWDMESFERFLYLLGDCNVLAGSLLSVVHLSHLNRTYYLNTSTLQHLSHLPYYHLPALIVPRSGRLSDTWIHTRFFLRRQNSWLSFAPHRKYNVNLLFCTKKAQTADQVPMMIILDLHLRMISTQCMNH